MSNLASNDPRKPEADVPPRSTTFQDVPGRSTSPQAKLCETKPPPGEMLTPRQLAAVRALAHGHTACSAASLLGTTRQTINRWRHLPAFAAELRRLHELLAVPSSAAAASVAPSDAAPRRSAPPQPRKRERLKFPEDPHLEGLINKWIGRS